MASVTRIAGTASTEIGPSGDNDWITTINITTDDGNEAQITAATYDAGDHSYRLKATSFSFFSSIPMGSTIDGITVEIDRRCFAGSAQDAEVRLYNASSVLVGDDKQTATAWPTTSAIATYGGSTDDWNAGLTADDVRSTNFGVALIVQADSANTDIGVDFIRVTIDYTPPPPQFITLSAITSAESVGTPSLILSPIAFVPTAVDTAEALGTPTLLAGAVSIIVTAIASEEAVGSHTLALTFPAADILPTAIDTAESVGTPSLILSNINIAPTAIASDEAVGAHTLKATSVINPSAIVSGEAVGSPTLKATASITPTAIPTGEAVGTPSLILSNINIAPSSITSSETTGTPVLLPGNVNIIIGGIPSGEFVGVPNLEVPIAGQSVSPTSISSEELFGLPTLIPGSVTIVSEGAASAEAFGFPVLAVGPVNIVVGGIPSAEAMGTPILFIVSEGGNWGKVNRTPTWSTTKRRGWHETHDSLVKTRKNEGNR